MKILELRLSNLNSLTGEWVIDFTHPHYRSDGIFLISGPTGAGKTTIFDAVCLALYGTTPRLGRITKGTNEIMSRQRNACYAEVLFETKQGRYRCTWSQQRNKSGNGLGEAKHEISDAGSGKILESKKRRVLEVIEQKTGMDFERFRRSILLAQGNFDSLLRADTEQKSRILEQITGTEIYTKISQRVHERVRGERERLDAMNSEIKEITLLDDDDERELRERVERLQGVEAGKHTALDAKERERAWLAGIENLSAEIGELDSQERALAQEHTEFADERKRLEGALRAGRLESKYTAIATIRAEQERDREQHQSSTELQESTAQATGKQSAQAREAEKILDRARAALAGQKPVLQQVRGADTDIANQKKHIETLRGSLDGIKQRQTDARARVEEIELQLGTERKNLDDALQYIQEHSADQHLIDEFTGIEKQCGIVLQAQDVLREAEAARQQAADAIANSREAVAAGISALQEAQAEVDGYTEKIAAREQEMGGLLGGKLLREHQERKESLLREMGLARTIAAMEEERKRLVDGKACPLCGSTTHPYAAGNIPEISAQEQEIETITALVDSVQAITAECSQLQNSLQTAGKRAAAQEGELLRLREKQKSAEENAEIYAQGVREKEAALLQARRALGQQLRPLGGGVAPAAGESAAANGDALNQAGIDKILTALRGRRDDWKQQQQQAGEIRERIVKLESTLEHARTAVKEIGQSVTEQHGLLGAEQKKYELMQSQRREIFADKDPDEEEKRLESAVHAAEQAHTAARETYGQTAKELHALEEGIKSLEQQMGERTTELDTLEKEFAGLLRDRGFDGMPQFLSARLPGDEIEKLSARAKELDDGTTNLKARYTDRRERLHKEQKRQLTDASLEDLQAHIAQLKTEAEQAHQEIAAAALVLEKNASAREQSESKRAAIEKQQQEHTQWERLHALIGSADGKKYRSFAQGLTFKLLTIHANRQLARITDRYLLMHAETGGTALDLNVVDNYQGGDIRSTSNLSGGESFLVSLALALGLSKMSSSHVQVDSLFLDEGFGTLDQDTLETALSALGELQQEGRIIGVISHIPILQERIATQINIRPISGGRSVITGPGCGRRRESR